MCPTERRPIEYHASTSFSRADVIANMMATELYTVIDCDALMENHPHREMFAKIFEMARANKR